MPGEVIVTTGTNKYVLDWTADENGDVSGVRHHITGSIVRVVFNPGTPAPAALHSVALMDEHGFDIFGETLGASLSATDTSQGCPGIPCDDGTNQSSVPVYVDGDLELVVEAAGDGGRGQVVLYVVE